MDKIRQIIRVNLVIPVALLIGLGWLYGLVFMDTHLKWALEAGLTQGVGAEVNIGKLRTHLLRGDIQIQDIQITDSDAPNRNLIVIGDVRFSWVWDALLRGKVVINTVSVEQIGWGVPRKKPGRVLPPPTKPTTSEQLMTAAMANLTAQSKGSGLEAILAVISGKSPDAILTETMDSLNTPKKVEILNKTIHTTQLYWSETLSTSNVPFTKVAQRVDAFQKGSFQTPDDVLKGIQEIQSIGQSVNAELERLNAMQKRLESDNALLQSQIRDVQSAITSDGQQLGKQLQFSALDKDALSAYVLQSYLSQFTPYITTYGNLMNRYVPPNLLHKKTDDPLLQAHSRDKGVVYTFGKPNGYPAWWVKEIVISSARAKLNPAIGEIKGKLTHLSENQSLTGHPLRFTLAADFPGININTCTFEMENDRRNGRSSDQLKWRIGGYPVTNIQVLKSSVFDLSLQSARGMWELTAQRNAKHIQAHLSHTLENSVLVAHSDTEVLDRIFNNAFRTIHNVDINLAVEGQLPSLSLRLDSSVGPNLVNALTRESDAYLQAEKNRIQSEIQAKLTQETESILKQANQLTDSYNAEIQKQLATLTQLQKEIASQQQKLQSQTDGLHQEAERKVNEATHQANEAVEREKNKAIQDIQKSLPKFQF